MNGSLAHQTSSGGTSQVSSLLYIIHTVLQMLDTLTGTLHPEPLPESSLRRTVSPRRVSFRTSMRLVSCHVHRVEKKNISPRLPRAWSQYSGVYYTRICTRNPQMDALAKYKPFPDDVRIEFTFQGQRLRGCLRRGPGGIFSAVGCADEHLGFWV